VRPGVRGRRPDRHEPDGLEREGPGHLRLLPGRRPAGPLCLDPPRRPACPPPVDHSKGYAWPMVAGYDIVSHALDGSAFRRLTDTPGTTPRRRSRPTAGRSSSPPCATGTSNLRHGRRRLEREAPHPRARLRRRALLLPRREAHRLPPGRPPDEASLARYRELLAQHLYRPGVLEIWVMDADSRNKHQVTTLGAASFAPYFHPDDQRISSRATTRTRGAATSTSG